MANDIPHMVSHEAKVWRRSWKLLACLDGREGAEEKARLDQPRHAPLVLCRAVYIIKTRLPLAVSSQPEKITPA